LTPAKAGDGKKYIFYKFPTSLLGWREKWFYIGNEEPSLPERTAGALKITTEWSKPCRDKNQILELLGMIKKQRNAGVTGVTVMYSWIGWRIQPLQKQSRFGFEYVGVLDPSCFSAVLMGAETVPYVPKMYSVKEPPKHVWISIHILVLKL
jgi:hypothetical protein